MYCVKIHITKFTILTMFKHVVQWYSQTVQLSVPPSPIRLLPCKSETLYLQALILHLLSLQPLATTVIVKVGQSCPTPLGPMDCTVHEILQVKTGVGSLSLSRGSSQPRDLTQVSCTAAGFFTSWATWEAPPLIYFLFLWFWLYVSQWSHIVFSFLWLV